MKIVGLITEYNPFHNGHQYHIEEALRITNADYAIVVMSGNYVQRGTPAILPKHLRAEMALRCGASMIIELPLQYATSSAEYFATGAVTLLDSLNCIDYLCFGSESGDLENLTKIASILLEEPNIYQRELQKNLKSGISFPLARQKAISYFLGNDDEGQQLLEDPNNILGIEYIKALRKIKSNIKPCTILRKESHYHDSTLSTTFSSASAIRNLLSFSGNQVDYRKGTSFKSSSAFTATNHLKSQMPKCCFSILEDHYNVRFPVYPNDFSLLLRQKLMNETKDSLLEYLDMTEELANRIVNLQNQYINYEQFCELLKSKNTTYTRISRTLLHILLNIRKTDFSNIWHQYIHIIGFRKDCKKLLTIINKKSALPMITKLTAVDSLNSQGKAMILKEVYAANLYECVVTNRYNTPFIHEYEQSIVMI